MMLRLDSGPTFGHSTFHSATSCRSYQRVLFCSKNRLLNEALACHLERDSQLLGLVATNDDVDPLEIGDVTASDIVVGEVRSSQDLVELQERYPAARIVALCVSGQEPEGDSSALLSTWPWQIHETDSLSAFLAVLKSAAGDDSSPDDPVGDNGVNASDDALSDQLQGLNPRERAVFRLLARGDSVKEVARELGLSFKSVDSQKYRIMRKLGLTDRVQLTRLAIRAGVISP